MTAKSELLGHFSTGASTVCRAWSVVRRDGVTYGFTDHDQDLAFDAMVFKASTGMTARALQQSTGLSVDNSEALGALSAAAITEADLLAGRFDGAEVRSWLVNWTNVAQRLEQFRGSFGEIVRAAGSVQAELRGLAEALNQPQGRVYHRSCSAVLGDVHCKFNLSQVGFFFEATIAGIDALGSYRFSAMPGFEPHWFDRGRMVVLTGVATGLAGLIKTDQDVDGARIVDLWTGLGATPAVGDLVRLEAGCDKLAATCRAKFANFLNFRGFPHIPGDDWVTSYPVSAQINDGGSLVR